MNQKQRILASDAPIHNIGTVRYKGRQPIYRAEYYYIGEPSKYIKIAPGIPFVRLEKDFN